MSLRELAEAVDTSEVTVRRDIRALEEQGVLDRRRGGAVWPGGLSHEQSYQQKRTVASAEKQAIGMLATSLVSEGDAIVVGAGSTTREFARRLARLPDLTVVTNSLLVAQVLSEAQGRGGAHRRLAAQVDVRPHRQRRGEVPRPGCGCSARSCPATA